MQPLVALRAPKLFNLRTDPFERPNWKAGDYDKWYVEHAFAVAPAPAIVGQFLQSFREFPPRQSQGAFRRKRRCAAFQRGLAIAQQQRGFTPVHQPRPHAFEEQACERASAVDGPREMKPVHLGWCYLAHTGSA